MFINIPYTAKSDNKKCIKTKKNIKNIHFSVFALTKISIGNFCSPISKRDENLIIWNLDIVHCICKMESPKEECIKELRRLTNKRFILFTPRGNASIKLALKLIKEKGRRILLIQDQGGWITYRQYAEKLKFSLKEIKTDYGLIPENSLEKNKSCALLINSLPAYAYYQEMNSISKICKRNDIFLINDASGSIGSKEAMYGNIILGSFGKWKPVDIGEGGFIATDEEKNFRFLSEKNTMPKELDFNRLLHSLKSLQKRLRFFDAANKRLKKELSQYDIIRRDKPGTNVIIKYKTAAEKEKIINYCVENNLPYTECPRYIRILGNAICIEVKRLEMR